MITNGGKEIISKYLLGQIPEYATHISIGCGAIPLDQSESYPSESILKAKTVMDFEMARVPVVSRGLVNDAGEIKIALTAELPKENRYDITEVGLWSAGSNVLASGFDSKILFTFNESWEQHGITVNQIPTIDTIGESGEITTTEKIFYASSSNATLRNSVRTARKEGPRFLNTKLLMRGDSSEIIGAVAEITSATAYPTSTVYVVDDSSSFSEGDVVTISGCSDSRFNYAQANITSVATGEVTIQETAYSLESGQIGTGQISYIGSGNMWETGKWVISPISTHIHNNSVSLDISKNSPNDKIKLAISLIDKTPDATAGDPDNVKIILQFFRNEVTTTQGFAKKEIYIDGAEFTDSRYRVIDIPISDFITSEDYASYEARTCRIFVSVEKSGSISSDYYVLLDSMRLDNITTANPLYKMVGYSVIKDDGNPIVKYPNTNNYVEFRFSLGV